MQRTQLEFLNRWISKRNRKPLIIRGARQVGKSTLIKLFSEKNNLQLSNINLERHINLSESFKKNDPQAIINVLESLPNINKISADSLLFLDEIQAVPEAIAALSYFYEDMPNQGVVAAGSLLEFVLSDHSFSMPVGRVEYLHMGPMTFTEFLDALKEEKLISIIREYQLGQEIDVAIHTRLMELLSLYFYIGGMPEAVDTYVETKNLREVSEVHQSIIDTYRDDFPKYIGTRNLSRIQNVFNFAARNIGVKVKYSHFSRDNKSATIKSDIELLCQAKILTKVIHSHCSGLPLHGDLEEKIYKLIFLDVGLMNATSGISWDGINLFTDRKSINQGAVAEQFIGQHLQEQINKNTNRDLTYWLREGKNSNAEVDYVIVINNKIVPIEIKSGTSGSLKSLHQFAGEKDISLAVRFDANMPSVQSINTKIRKKYEEIEVSYKLVSLPLYLVERLNELISETI